MLTLALDTSTRLGSVALGAGEELLAEMLLSTRARGAESVLPWVDRLLGHLGRSPDELEAIVVGAGPGSFTGVRIAASLAKGFRAALGIDLYAYSSLAAVAAGAGRTGDVCVLFPARRDEVYAAAWTTLTPPTAAVGPRAGPVAALLEELGECGGWSFAGEGALVHRRLIERRGGRVLPFHLAPPRAAGLLWLRAEAPEAGRVEEPSAWEPEYVRRSGAERGAVG